MFLTCTQAWHSHTCMEECLGMDACLLLCTCVLDSQNHSDWKRPLRSSSPTFNLVLTSPPLNHATKFYIYIYIFLKTARDGDSNTYLSSLFQCCTTLSVRKFSPNI